MAGFKNGLLKVGDTYHYCFRIHGQQYKGSTRARDHKTAKKVLETKRQEALLGAPLLQAAPPTVSALVKDWLLTHAHITCEGHRKGVEIMTRIWLNPVVGDIPIDKVTQASTIASLIDLQQECIIHGQSVKNPMVHEHMLHGAGRRISVLRRAVQNIYDLFPPSTTTPLPRDTLSDVQINLHAFVINLYGVFENWAWAYFYRHQLQTKLTERRQVGMFLPSMRPFLPLRLREYLSSNAITNWQRDYLTNYRDALVHRIPLYIPPANFTQEESERFSLLESARIDSLRAGDLSRFEEISVDQEAIGVASLMFLHSFSEGGEPKPILLHPQVLCDSKTVVEFGTKFLACWHETA